MLEAEQHLRMILQIAPNELSTILEKIISILIKFSVSLVHPCKI